MLDLAPTPKKVKVDAQNVQKHENECSPAKKRCLEDQGLVVMDGPDGLLEHNVAELDVIVIDD